jgi:hypothetical protein
MPSATTNKSTQQRRGVWLAWTFSALITIGFVVLALITFANLINTKHDLNNYNNNTNLNITTANILLESDEFDAALAGTFMAAFLCIAVTVVSFLLLAQKSLFSSTRGSTPGFAYAFMTSSFLHTAIFLILEGIILVGIRSKVEAVEGVPSATTTTTDPDHDLGDGTTTPPPTTTTYWSSTDTAVLITTMVFAFITAGIYIFMFTVMILFRKSVQHSDGGTTSTLLAGRMQSHQLPVTASPTTALPTTATTTTTTPLQPTKKGGFLTSAFHSPPSPRLYDTPSDYVDSVEMARRKQSYGAWGS